MGGSNCARVMPVVGRRPWTREELLEVLRLYCVTSFGLLDRRNPDVIALAARLDRTPDAVAFKLVNFASLDPTIDRRGMANTSALDRTIWAEFFDNMERFLPSSEVNKTKGLEEAQQVLTEPDGREGIDSIGLSKRRINQGFFRSMIIASYDSRCAMTAISDRRLLVASHIDPWAQNAEDRMNPHNGMCLNYLHDRAFENGLIAVAPDLSILYSPQLPPDDLNKLRSVTFEKLAMPSRFKPDMAMLEKHRLSRFQS